MRTVGGGSRRGCWPVVLVVFLVALGVALNALMYHGRRLSNTEETLAETREALVRLQAELGALQGQIQRLHSSVPLSGPQEGQGATAAATGGERVITVPPIFPGGPTEAHVFDSGVRVWKHFLRKSQRERFEQDNLWEKVDERLITAVLRHARKGDVFLDLGAALGYYSLLARRISSEIEVHAFNPHPKFVARMRQNMQLNGVSDITIHQMAIADRPMQGIKITSAGFGGRLQPNKVGTINTTTLNEFLPTLGLDRPGRRLLLIKADIEGFELKMLSAADRCFGVAQNWVIAIHQTRQQCGEVLRAHGYTIVEEEAVQVEGEPNGVLVATLDRQTFFPPSVRAGVSAGTAAPSAPLNHKEAPATHARDAAAAEEGGDEEEEMGKEDEGG
eukprot:RCo035059